ncbi:MAG: YwiC-like family protein, partial [Caldilineaceae bacterium]
MTTYSNPKTKQKARPRWRSIALPTEHGGWGFLLEPLLLGRLVAPSTAGLLLLIATVAAFLLRQPLKIVLVDRRRGQQSKRTEMARRFALLYALLALVAAVGTLALAGPRFLLALAC